MVDFGKLELGWVDTGVGFDAEVLGVGSSLLGCCKRGKEVVELGRVQRNGKGRKVVVDGQSM